ncbi:MAG: NUDIX domain-containing protein [Candidatus Woesearchaeota archaeon]|nr:MAG: NUDIX domain-containing protein [Candidatus Woesearchaeota archaeon]
MLPRDNQPIPTEQYKYIVEHMPLVCIDLAIINDEGKVLVVKRGNEPAKDHWWPVGGRILKNELIKDAAIRKAKEEAGVNVTFDKVLGVDETLFPESNLGILSGTHTVNVIARVRMNPGEKVNLDKDHKDYQFVSKADPSWHPYAKRVIREGLEQ